jgi:hypothetical protein
MYLVGTTRLALYAGVTSALLMPLMADGVHPGWSLLRSVA